MQTGTEGEEPRYPTPDELWNMTLPSTRSGTGDAADKASELAELWRDRFAAVPLEDRGGYFLPRYYQDIAIERVMDWRKCSPGFAGATALRIRKFPIAIKTYFPPYLRHENNS